MSPWLKPLPLKSVPGIGTLNRRLDGFPAWAAFMVWCGWWLRETIIDDKRLVAVLVLPNRSCCSALCSFGALVASTQVIYAGMSWNDFLLLPEGMEIYLKDGERNLTAKLGKTESIYGYTARKVCPLKLNRYKDSSIIVNECNFSNKQISLLPHVNNRDLPTVLRYYKASVAKVSKSWASSMVTECRILTNKSQWHRDIEDLMLFSYEDQHEYNGKLSSLLFVKSYNEYNPPKVSILSPKSINKIYNRVKLTISDGAESLPFTVNNISKTHNQLIIMTQVEYDNSCLDMISNISQYRCQNGVAIPGFKEADVPRGVNLSIFAMPFSGEMQ